MSTTGLRERKKARTRAEIVRAALELFAYRGFAATTVAQIADAAQVSQRTFFRYFPAKDDVVFDGFDERLENWEHNLLAAPAGTPLGEAMRRVTLDTVPAFSAADAARRLDLIASDPRLARRMAEFNQRAGQRAARAIAARLGVDIDTDPRPRVIAAATMAAVWTTTRMSGVAEPERIAAIDRAFAMLRDFDSLLDLPLPA